MVVHAPVFFLATEYFRKQWWESLYCTYVRTYVCVWYPLIGRSTFPYSSCVVNSPSYCAFCSVPSTYIHTYVVWVQCVCSTDLVHCFITCICRTVHCEWLYEPSSPLRFQFNNLLTGKYSVSASHPTWDVAKVRMYVLTYILTYICMCMYVWIYSSEELLLLPHWIAKCNSSKTSPWGLIHGCLLRPYMLYKYIPSLTHLCCGVGKQTNLWQGSASRCTHIRVIDN